MASTTQTLTVDTTNAGSRGGEWVYIDKFGSPHTITNGQTLTFSMSDASTTNVVYIVDKDQELETDDGLKLSVRRMVNGSNTAHELTMADAFEGGTANYSLPGEIAIACPKSGDVQYWKSAVVDIDDVDSPSTIARWKLEDQFGNVMDLPTDDAGTITFA